ncbi:MAG TPA: hypothetical protein VKR30_12355 [Candidatus Limnocylindrales bacterium]|nr:hypothetical protein [Candidatus Limnocylindrales bacterium]
MRLDRRLLGWGIFFILLGVVPLAVRAGAVDPDLVGRWAELWPLLLIGWGLGLVLRATPIDWLGGAVTAITLGVMGGGLIATGFSGIPMAASCTSQGGQAFQTQTSSFAGPARLNVEFNCGSLDVTTADGSTWAVNGSDSGGIGPVIETDPNGAVTIKGQPSDFAFNVQRATWHVSVPKGPQLELGVTLNAGDGTVDLGGAALSAFNLTVNAGSMSADLSSAASLPPDGLNATVNAGKASISMPAFDGAMNLSLNAGSLDVCVPSSAPIAVHWSGTIASNDLADAGLVQGPDNTWSTHGLDLTAPHVTLDVSANAGSFSLERGGSCGA